MSTEKFWTDGSFWKDQVNKILVFFLIVMGGFLLLHLIHHDHESSSDIDKAWQVVNYLLGLLSGLIYPRVAASVSSGKKTDGNGGDVDDPPPTPPTKTVVTTQTGDATTTAKISSGD